MQRIGLDQQRATFALDLADLLDVGEHVLQGSIAGPDLADIKQRTGELRRIGLGHVDPADALVLLRHTGALRQIEGEPAGGAVVRGQHACGSRSRPRRFDRAGRFAPADADAAHSGIAAIARQRAGVGLYDQQHEHQDSARRSPAPAEINQALPARLPFNQMRGDGGGDRKRRIDRRKPVGLDAGMQRMPNEIGDDDPEHRIDERTRRQRAGASAEQRVKPHRTEHPHQRRRERDLRRDQFGDEDRAEILDPRPPHLLDEGNPVVPGVPENDRREQH